ncbi:hypothetical protein KJ797_04050, partial [Patescibacteria group bacterium]|nr:hypothetical protein [Patescibacteria group bacterium]
SADFQIGTYAVGIGALSTLTLSLGNGNIHTPDTSVMTWQGSGNVGIGTTGPGSKFHIHGSNWNGLTLTNADLASKIGTLKWDSLGTYVTGKSFLILSDETTNVDGSNAGIMFRVNNGPIGGYTFPAMVIRETGNVGIGTVTPGARLQVSGTLNGGSADARGVIIDPTLMTTNVNGLTHTGLLATPTFNTTSSNVANVYGIKISPNHTGTYTTTNAYGLYVDATTVTSGIVTNNYAAVFNGGNVGIGTTGPRNGLELAKLDSNYITSLRVGGVTGGTITVPLQSETSRHQILFSSWRDVVTDTVGAKIAAINKNVYQANNALVQNTDLAFFTLGTTPTGSDNTTEVMRITNTGNVGIGTTGPGMKLQVIGSAGTNVISAGAGGNRKIALAVGSNRVGLHLRNDTVAHTGISSDGTDLFFGTASLTGSPDTWGTDLVTIKSSGNVGIGTTAPTNTLNILGGITNSGISIPVNATFTAGTGTLAIGTYYYRVTALTSSGETTPSTETSLALSAIGGVNVNWTAITGAIGYKIYGRSASAELYIAQVGAGVTTYLDSGAITPAGAMPTVNTTGNVYLASNGFGNVGIGTMTPGVKLDVLGGNGAGDEVARFAGAVAVGKVDAEVGILRLFSATGRNMSLSMNDTNDAVISNTFGKITITPITNFIISQGNVGIGTTAPGAKLEIRGTAEGVRLNVLKIVNTQSNAEGGAAILIGPYGNESYMSRISA